MPRILIAAAAAVFILGASFVAPAAQATTFNFLSPAGSLGKTQSYTLDGLTITAAGFNSSNFTTPDVNLFAKTGGGDENGLGLTNDLSRDNEITRGSYIRIAIPTANISSVSFTMDSTTAGGSEVWNVYGSNSATSLGTLLLTGASETSNSLALYPYYFFTANKGNVLLGSFTIVDPPPTPTTPLPGALPLFAGGLGAMGLLGWRRKRKARAVA
jgi:hypothetical protein